MDTLSLPELWIRYSTGMTIRESEMQTRASRPVQNVWWCFVAEPVSPIAREPQLARVRMPVESDRIANPACEHFQIAAVRVHPCNRCVPRLLVSSIAHVARSPDGHVELPVRAERDVLPTVHPIRRERAVHDDRLGGIVEARLDPVVPKNPVDLGDIKRTVTECHAVRHVQPRVDGDDLVRFVIVVPVQDGVDLTRVRGRVPLGLRCMDRGLDRPSA